MTNNSPDPEVTADAVTSAARLEAWLDRIMVGGNHLATALIGMLEVPGKRFPHYRTAPDEARQIIGDLDKWEAWMCWKTIILIRDERLSALSNAVKPEPTK